MEQQEFVVRPIGVIHTGMRVKFDAPHQPEDGIEEKNVIELLPGQCFDRALHDLSGFDRIWLVWWFHRNSIWRPKVLPPRGSANRRGVFATRAPHRPNPIGLTAVRLLGVEDRKIFIGNCDLIDGTPILDIKPYIASIDSFPDASRGWLDEVESELALPPSFEVKFSPLAQMQIEWLKTLWEVNFIQRATELLSRDPSPHRTRRISRLKNNFFRMGCGAWRLLFTVNNREVLIDRVTSGYPDRLLVHDPDNKVPDREAQLAFKARWPDPVAYGSEDRGHPKSLVNRAKEDSFSMI